MLAELFAALLGIEGDVFVIDKDHRLTVGSEPKQQAQC